MDKQGGLRKRQQISHANRMMFVWIAGVSVVVGFCIVLMVFLVQKIWFGEKVIDAKMKTVSTLEQNIKIIPSLNDNVRLLNTNEALKSVRQNDNDSALQPVLDALPADANSTALASSLQTKLLSGVTGVTIDSLNVDPVSGIEVASTDTSVGEGSDPVTGTIGFSFSVSAAKEDREGLRQVLKRLESSIRPFTITSLSVESQGSRIVMTATGVGYYELGQKMKLTDKVIRP